MCHAVNWEFNLANEPTTVTASFIKRLAHGLLVICLIPVFLVVAPVVFALSLTLSVSGWVWLRWHAWRSGNRHFVICSRRRGWREFVVNNLQPALPDGVELAWADQKTGFMRAQAIHLVLRSAHGLKKPCLAGLTPLGMRIESLHDELLPSKHCGEKDEQLQHMLRETLQRRLNR